MSGADDDNQDADNQDADWGRGDIRTQSGERRLILHAVRSQKGRIFFSRDVRYNLATLLLFIEGSLSVLAGVPALPGLA